MANERSWNSLGPLAFTANGGADGVVTVASTNGMRVKQQVIVASLSKPSGETAKLEIKRVLSLTKLIVGPIETKGEFLSRQNLSAYTTADMATIKVIEQKKSKPTEKDIMSFLYEAEPVVALRTFPVDEQGQNYTQANPFPVSLSSGSISIGSINAQLTHKDNDPESGDIADSVRIGDGVDEVSMTKAATGTVVGMNVNAVNDLFSKPFNKLTVLTKNDDGDPLTIRSSYSGVPVQLLTIVYDADGDFEDAEVSNL